MKRSRPLAAALVLALAPAAAQAAVPSKLAYVTGLAGSHPRVNVANGDGSGAVTLGAGIGAWISPDGANVAIETPVTRSGGTTLVVRPASGGPARTLVSSALAVDDPVWSPDGTRLAVASDNQLLIVDVATGVLRPVANGAVLGMSFSPDGAQLAYGHRGPHGTNVFVVRVDGTGRHAITHDGRSSDPLWGPRRVVFVHMRPRRNDGPAFQLRLMDPSGAHVRQLTHMRVPRFVSGLTPTAWSADGRRLLAEYGGEDTSEAWTVDVRSGRARDLTGRFDNVIGAGLSADGSTVLVQRGSFEDPAHQSIATIPFGRGAATVLVAHGSTPSWGG